MLFFLLWVLVLVFLLERGEEWREGEEIISGVVEYSSIITRKGVESRLEKSSAVVENFSCVFFFIRPVLVSLWFLLVPGILS